MSATAAWGRVLHDHHNEENVRTGSPGCNHRGDVIVLCQQMDFLILRTFAVFFFQLREPAIDRTHVYLRPLSGAQNLRMITSSSPGSLRDWLAIPDGHNAQGFAPRLRDAVEPFLESALHATRSGLVS
jgi:hypothetical protein